MSCWHVYLLKCQRGDIYTGIATDVQRRLAEHQGASSRGAKALRGRGPLRLLRAEPVGSRGPAQRVEARIKRLTKSLKEDLAARPQGLRQLVREVLEEYPNDRS
jgi:putative endonuclease